MWALAINSVTAKVLNNGVFPIAGEHDHCLIVRDFTTVKVQGSLDGGSTYNDIAGSLVTAVTEGTDIAVISLTNCRFDHVKVVATTLSTIQCTVTKSGMRNTPFTGLNRAFVKVLGDPIAGTA